MTKNIHVYPDNRLLFGNETVRCALGPAGIIPATDKREGDGATPAGNYPIRGIWYRADRVRLPPVNFAAHEITPGDGWCDAPDHPKYNQHITLPFTASHETLWREDELYNVVVVIGHNDAPPVPGMGSAIFWHIARPAYTPTHGCIAISQTDMLRILPQLSPGTEFRIHTELKA